MWITLLLLLLLGGRVCSLCQSDSSGLSVVVSLSPGACCPICASMLQIVWNSELMNTFSKVPNAQSSDSCLRQWQRCPGGGKLWIHQTLADVNDWLSTYSLKRTEWHHWKVSDCLLLSGFYVCFCTSSIITVNAAAGSGFDVVADWCASREGREVFHTPIPPPPPSPSASLEYEHWSRWSPPTPKCRRVSGW